MREALKLALEALEKYARDFGSSDLTVKAMYVARQALAQPEQEPVAMKFKIYLPVNHQINNAELPWVYDQDRSSGAVASMWVTPVATLPPQRTWVGLTDEEMRKICGSVPAMREAVREAEAKLKEKNT